MAFHLVFEKRLSTERTLVWGRLCHFLNSQESQKKMDHPAHAKGNRKDHCRDPEGPFQTPLLDHHKELSNAGDEESDGHQAHQDLVRIEQPFSGKNQ